MERTRMPATDTVGIAISRPEHRASGAYILLVLEALAGDQYNGYTGRQRWDHGFTSEDRGY